MRLVKDGCYCIARCPSCGFADTIAKHDMIEIRGALLKDSYLECPYCGRQFLDYEVELEYNAVDRYYRLVELLGYENGKEPCCANCLYFVPELRNEEGPVCAHPERVGVEVRRVAPYTTAMETVNVYDEIGDPTRLLIGEHHCSAYTYAKQPRASASSSPVPRPSVSQSPSTRFPTPTASASASMSPTARRIEELKKLGN